MEQMKNLADLIQKRLNESRGIEHELIKALVNKKITDHRAIIIYEFFLHAFTVGRKLIKGKPYKVIKYRGNTDDYNLVKGVYQTLKQSRENGEVIMKNVFMPYDVKAGVVLVAYNHGRFLPLRPNIPFRYTGQIIESDRGVVDDLEHVEPVVIDGEVNMFLVDINYKSTYAELAKILL